MLYSQGLPKQIFRIYTISFRSILIFSSHLCLGLPKDLFPIGLPVKILKALLPSSILVTWPAYLNFLGLIALTILGERYKLISSLLWSLLYSPFASLFGPNICLRTLFSNTFSLHSSLNVNDRVSEPYSTTDNIIVSYNLIFKLWNEMYNYRKLIKNNGSKWKIKL